MLRCQVVRIFQRIPIRQSCRNGVRETISVPNQQPIEFLFEARPARTPRRGWRLQVKSAMPQRLRRLSVRQKTKLNELRLHWIMRGQAFEGLINGQQFIRGRTVRRVCDPFN